MGYEIDVERNITVVCINDGYCSNNSYCNINVEDPDGIMVVENQNMTNQISFHSYNFTPTEIGTYGVTGFCKDGDVSNEIDFGIEVSYTGGAVPTGFNGRLFLLLCFVLLFVGLVYLQKEINFDKWYKSMLDKYYTKNFVKVALSAIGYNIMKRTIVLYYLIGFVVMLSLLDIVLIYNISAMFDIMQGLMYMYAWGSILVGLIFLSYIQEFVMNAVDDIKNMGWGFDTGGK